MHGHKQQRGLQCQCMSERLMMKGNCEHVNIYERHKFSLIGHVCWLVLNFTLFIWPF